MGKTLAKIRSQFLAMSTIVFSVLLFEPTAAFSAPQCPHEDAHHLVLSRNMVSWTGEVDSYATIVVAELEDAHPENHSTRTVSSVTAYFAPFIDKYGILEGIDCSSTFSLKLPFESAQIKTGYLGRLGVMDVIGARFGASGSLYSHNLVSVDETGIRRIQSPDFSVSNQGGLHLGDLSRNLGVGVVVWDRAVTDERECHYCPHRYEFKFYQWNGSAFLASQTITTKDHFDPTKPDNVPKALGYKFQSDTDTSQMPRALTDPSEN